MRALIIAVSLWLVATAAAAHAFLDHAVPAVGARVAVSPAVLRLYFTEPVELLFSGVELRDAAGRPIAIGAVTRHPQNPAALVASLPVLAPGRYQVHWHVVSIDTHRTEGSFEFEIAP